MTGGFTPNLNPAEKLGDTVCLLKSPTSKTGEIQPPRAALNVEATRKCRCVGAGGQVSGVLPGPGRLLPAEDGETPEQGVPVPAAEQTDGLHLLRAGGERAALRYVWPVFAFFLRMLQVRCSPGSAHFYLFIFTIKNIVIFIPILKNLLHG